MVGEVIFREDQIFGWTDRWFTAWF